MVTDVYLYKMTADNGGAPCVDNGQWSLAICKPKIRATAPVGALILGFAATPLDSQHGLIHLARVSRRLEKGEYYDLDKYRGRSDCIYRRSGSGWVQLRSDFHGVDDLARDVGMHAPVIWSEDFRYFGRSRFQVDRSKFPRLRLELGALKQGHRRWHDEVLLKELHELADAAFKSSSQSVLGQPASDRHCRCVYDNDGPEGICKVNPARCAR